MTQMSVSVTIWLLDVKVSESWSTSQCPLPFQQVCKVTRKAPPAHLPTCTAPHFLSSGSLWLWAVAPTHRRGFPADRHSAGLLPGAHTSLPPPG